MNTSVDFFNAIVTLSSVVLFAKFVTHRSRRQSLPTRLRRLHVTCVMSSIGALTFAFVSLELERDAPPMAACLGCRAHVGIGSHTRVRCAVR